MRLFTIWKFTSPSSGEEKVVARPTEPCEHQHEYQVVLTRVMANNQREALKQWTYE